MLNLILLLLSQRAQRSCINKSAGASKLSWTRSKALFAVAEIDVAGVSQSNVGAAAEEFAGFVKLLSLAGAASLPLSGFLCAPTARFSPLLFCLPVIRAPM